MAIKTLVCRKKLGDPISPLSDSSHITISRSHPVVELASPTAVRVRIRATSSNCANYLQILGKHQEKPPLPFIPGSDYSSVVESVGERVSRFTAIKFALLPPLGLFAEFIVTDKKDLWGTTETGQVLLVLGAAGGVGISAVRIGKVCGAVVIAVAGGKEKVHFLRSLGVHVVELGKGKCYRKYYVLYDLVGGWRQTYKGKHQTSELWSTNSGHWIRQW